MKLNSSFWKMSSLSDLDGLYSLLKDCFFFFFFTILGIRIDEENVIKGGCPPSFQKKRLWIPMFSLQYLYVPFDWSLCSSIMAQSIPSMPILLPLSGICWAFVFLFWFEKLQMPHFGAGRLIQKPHCGASSMQMPYPGTSPKLPFPVKKLQMLCE